MHDEASKGMRCLGQDFIGTYREQGKVIGAVWREVQRCDAASCQRKQRVCGA